MVGSSLRQLRFTLSLLTDQQTRMHSRTNDALYCTSIFSHADTYNPTYPFTILEPQDQEIGQIYVAHDRRTTDFEAPKL